MLFYVFFEATLIPMYLIIGIWGGPQRHLRGVQVLPVHAARLAADADRADLPVHQVGRQLRSRDLAQTAAGQHGADAVCSLPSSRRLPVKVPMWPVHTWLPDAHVEAPTGGSAVLAAIMLKLGAYGFLRFSHADRTGCARANGPGFMIALSLIAVVYVGLVAMVQQDMKKLVAYSSVAHMGFVTLGFFIFNDLGVSGGHGADDRARLRVGRHVPVHRRVVRPRALARDCQLRRRGQHHAQVRRLRRCCSAMANCGLPGTAGFVGEWMVILGAVKFNFWIGFAGGQRPDFRRRLHAVDVQARVPRRRRQ